MKFRNDELNKGKGEVFDIVIMAYLWDEFFAPKLPPIQQVVRDMVNIYAQKKSKIIDKWRP